MSYRVSCRLKEGDEESHIEVVAQVRMGTVGDGPAVIGENAWPPLMAWPIDKVYEVIIRKVPG